MARTSKIVYVFLCILLTLLVEGSVTDALHISSGVKKSPSVKVVKENDSRLFASSMFRTGADAKSIPFQDDVGNVLQSKLLMIPSQILQGRSQVQNAAVSLTKAGVSLIKKWWWALPFSLAFVPVYTTLVHNVLPTMPSWWPLTKMDQLLHHPSSNLIITAFLSSNLFYFISGSYLLVSLKRNSNVLAQGFSKLGMFILTAGVVSTVFHYFQALGSFQIAEALCYVDHAVAISSILYFWQRCGRPGLVASILGGLGLVTLAITEPLSMYPWLHSTWHGLSAGAAVCWAHDGVRRRLDDNESCGDN